MKGTSPKRIPLNITTDDWVATSSDATQPRPGDSGNKTVNELSRAMGVNIRIVRIRIAELTEENRIIFSREKRRAIDGMRSVPVYRLKEPISEPSSSRIKELEGKK